MKKQQTDQENGVRRYKTVYRNNANETKTTIQTVQTEAHKRARKIQLNFTQFMMTNTATQRTKDKRKEEKQNKQHNTSVELAH